MDDKEFTNKELMEYVKLFDKTVKWHGDRFSMSADGFRKMIIALKEKLGLNTPAQSE